MRKWGWRNIFAEDEDNHQNLAHDKISKRSRSNTISSHLNSQNFPSPHNIICYITFAVLLLNLCSTDAYPSVLKSENYFNDVQEYYPAFSKKPSKNTNKNHGIPDIFNDYIYEKNKDDQALDQWHNIQRQQSNTNHLQNVKEAFHMNDYPSLGRFPTVINDHGDFPEGYTFRAPARVTNNIHIARDPKHKSYERMIEVLSAGNSITPTTHFRKQSIENDASIPINPLINRQKEQKTTKLVSGVLDDLSRESGQLPYLKYWTGDLRTSNDPEKEVLLKSKRASSSESKRTISASSLMKMLMKMKAQGFDIRTHRSDKTLGASKKPRKITPENVMVCKSAPYNICYKLDQKAGKLIPVSRRIKPVRLLRVY